MKKLAILFLVAIVSVSCKTEPEKENFPAELGRIFEKHGGIDNWRKARTLSFNLGEEAHTSDLWSRKTAINSPKYSLGFDGKDVWLSEKDSGAYRGNPKFYHNLMFYFYAMPFVLADDGIIYEEAESITFEEKEYKGIKISYKSNVGTSPDDNYVVYYNPLTYQMEWLAYTVTFRSKKPSDSFRLIKYGAWENVDGLQFPKSITWYKKDDSGQPTEPARSATEFTLPFINETPLQDSFYEKPKE
tara:strand:- start:5540 stop:6271 length:732 start_codon:yes stop_codon:yes gene_type:complete